MKREDLQSRLKEAIKGKGMSQKEFAKKVFTPNAAGEVNTSDKVKISNYINGKALPPLDVAIKMADELSVTLDWLCGRPDTNDCVSTDETDMLQLIRCFMDLEFESKKPISFKVRTDLLEENSLSESDVFDLKRIKKLEKNLQEAFDKHHKEEINDQLVDIGENFTFIKHPSAICISNRIYSNFITDYKSALKAGRVVMKKYGQNQEVADDMKRRVVEKYINQLKEPNLD